MKCTFLEGSGNRWSIFSMMRMTNDPLQFERAGNSQSFPIFKVFLYLDHRASQLQSFGCCVHDGSVSEEHQKKKFNRLKGDLRVNTSVSNGRFYVFLISFDKEPASGDVEI